MKRVLRVLMDSHPTRPVPDFRNVTGVDLIVGHGGELLETLTFGLSDFAIVQLLKGPGCCCSALLIIRFLHRVFFPRGLLCELK